MGSCLSNSGQHDNDTVKTENNQRKIKKRSGSMQHIWNDNWKELIEDRTKSRMKGESVSTQCNASYDECNCVQRAIFVMNIYKFWNDRKHIELDIDHIVQVITKELANYSSEQMINDFKHSKQTHDINELNDLFQLKCKPCGGNECPVLQRQDTDKNNNIENDNAQRKSTLLQLNPQSLRLMKILDAYHCYFLHKVDDIQNDDD
eukprot:261902_1